MTAALLLDKLRRQGLTLTADGEKLRLRGPCALLTPSLLDAVRPFKPELLALLAPPLSPQVRWRAHAMLLQRGDGALPLLVARLGLDVTEGFCFSCGEELAAPPAAGRISRCEACRQAAEWVCRTGSQ